MLKPIYTKKFMKDYQKLISQGKKIEKLDLVIDKLIAEEILEAKYDNHKLQGKLKNHFDCHIEGDWILIYLIDKEKKKISFRRTGSHSEIFGK